MYNVFENLQLYLKHRRFYGYIKTFFMTVKEQKHIGSERKLSTKKIQSQSERRVNFIQWEP